MNYQTVLQNYHPTEQGDFMLRYEIGGRVHIPADTRSAFPVISVQSPVSIQCCWQS